MEKIQLNWKIAGKAGDGVMLAAKFFAKLCQHHGLQVFNYYEYPSLIKGGHQTGQVYASSESASCQRRHLDLLVLFHPKFLAFHLDALDEKSVVLINAKSFDSSQYPQLKARVITIPFSQIAKQEVGDALMANMMMIAASAKFFDFKSDQLLELVKKEFAGNKRIIEQNQQAINLAYQELGKSIQEAQLDCSDQTLEAKAAADKNLLLTGNEAVGLGAIAAGLQFYSAYPMTPATGLLHYLAAQQENYPLVVKHTEDEIGAINQALGAAYAGVRAMTGTSGGGYALMVEATSLAGVAEIPLVILEAMRPGPATGLPTWSGQADLNFIVHAGHGDFPKVVFTPGSVLEHYQLSKLAFYIAEKYQLPVFILSDKYILESQQTMPQPDLAIDLERFSLLANQQSTGEKYLRYQDTVSGISPRAIPGLDKAVYLANSYEHDQEGFATEESLVTKRAMDKRLRKMETMLAELPKPQVFGAPATAADKILISFGSTINVLQELLNLLVAAKINQPAIIHLPCVAPFLSKDFEQLFDWQKINEGKQAVYTVEGTATAQLAQLLRANSQLKNIKSILRYDGRPFYAEDLLEWFQTQKINEVYQIK
ncbi:MAG TPA: 2-oxoacid:acceptor oxidoreductase subunit alpha [Candidatus Woesebacteria bacterium]|nr:2-oxoacid:acceptor oxidoreductase subunit alpha [Candidatus Woesebacteria bacterium]